MIAVVNGEQRLEDALSNSCHLHGCGSIKKILLVLVSILALPSCAVMHQSRFSESSIDNQVSSTVKVVPITSSLIRDISDQQALPAKRNPLPPIPRNWAYTAGAGDVLSIIVWDHPQLTIPAGPQKDSGNRVNQDGTIFYPYVGVTEVSGKTIVEIRQAITKGLKRVVPSPQVDVSIAEFNSQKVHIAGEINSPGSIALTNVPLNLLDALELKGSTNDDADLEGVKLFRNGVEYDVNLRRFLETGDLRNNPQLLNGDKIVVPAMENNEVYVLGEVKNPKVVQLTSDPMSLTDAIASSDGMSKSNASASGIFVFRNAENSDGVLVYQLDARNPVAFLMGTRFNLQPADVVYVTAAPATRWSRLISNIIPSLGFVNTLLLINDRT